MIQKFIEEGYDVVEFEEKADVYIVNTCTVTNMSDRKSRQMLRRVKSRNKDAILVACGCYAQVAKEELEDLKEIDLVLGNDEKKDIVRYVNDYMENREKSLILSDVMHRKEFVDFGTTTYTEKTRAVIKVQDGCDRFCSYCIIPYARGRVRSRQLESVVQEVTEIAKKGIKEVVITGIHIASYGKDFIGKNISLINLLEAINKVEGIQRIRLGSLEPMIITSDFVTRLKKLDKICEHFHLSLQSGCDETLKRMNRRYNTSDFESVVELLKSAYPDVALTTDIIVGFPGETEEEFNKTYDFLKKIKFYKMHVFKYSQRDGTKAAVMPNQVSANIKDERSNKLIELSNNNEKEFNEKYLQNSVEVLFEEKEDGYIKGHTRNYIMVKIKDEGKYKENEIYNICF